MSDNYFNIIKGGYIRAYLKYYLDLKYLLSHMIGDTKLKQQLN